MDQAMLCRAYLPQVTHGDDILTEGTVTTSRQHRHRLLEAVISSEYLTAHKHAMLLCQLRSRRRWLRIPGDCSKQELLNFGEYVGD